MSALADLAIEAHGGAALWAGAEEVVIEVSSGGLAFASKFQGSAVRATQVHISTTAQHVVLDDFPREGQRGVFEPDGSVRIEGPSGEVIASRDDPRSAFSDVRHRLWWDRLDILYFASFALWTYLATPFVFTAAGYELTELGPWEQDGVRWERLGVRFPEGVHTHCREQVFHIDSGGVIRRHDYTAEPLGRRANAAHYCSEHQRFDGLLLPTIRRVYPRAPDGRSRPHPRLVWIDIPSASVRLRPGTDAPVL